jgi:hypothetical protein
MEQAVLDLPAGRYIVDIFDVASDHRLISRETAAASPLVIGLPCRGVPLLVRISEAYERSSFPLP